MKLLKEFKERPNTHQTHMEDLVLLGEDGLNEFCDKVEKFINKLNGGNKLNLTTKIDGAPAVICWSSFEGYPDNSICLKSFVSGAKNALTSVEDIQAKYGDRPDMAKKLEYCLQLAKCIPAGEAWQGDCLYSSDDLRHEEINGVNYLVFHPNKIMYAFTDNDAAYEEVSNSDFGICFHTIYRGDLEKKTQSFRVDVSRLSNVPSNIYIMSPALSIPAKDDFSLAEINSKFQEFEGCREKLIRDPDYEDLISNTVFMNYWNTFENANLSDKKAVTFNVDTFLSDLDEYIKVKRTNEYNKKIGTLKTEKGKNSATEKYNRDIEELEEFISSKASVIINIVKALNLAAEIKMLMWEGLKASKQGYKTFYKSATRGYLDADMEGVAMSDMDGNIVKIVDRSTFSNANRDPDILSGFMHEDYSGFGDIDD